MARFPQRCPRHRAAGTTPLSHSCCETEEVAPSLFAAKLKPSRVAARLRKTVAPNSPHEVEVWWKERQCCLPAPSLVKWAVLERYGHCRGTWVETGTFLGDTTAHLARQAAHIYSIEPGPALAARAKQRFQSQRNVTIVQGTSEDVLDGIVADLRGPASFWLDGHFSAGITFQGPADTPIREELATIERHLGHLAPVTVLVDDVRCFDPDNSEYATYPPREWLVDWAVRNHLKWTIEHDIFVAWSPVSSQRS